MSFSQKHTVSVSSGTEDPITTTNTYQGGAQANLSDVANGDNTTLVNWAVPSVANIKALSLKSDVAVTIKTNDADDPDDTIELAAGVQVEWTPDSPTACPLTTDVQKIYVVVPGDPDANLEFRCIFDPTP